MVFRIGSAMKWSPKKCELVLFQELHTNSHTLAGAGECQTDDRQSSKQAGQALGMARGGCQERWPLPSSHSWGHRLPIQHTSQGHASHMPSMVGVQYGILCIMKL